MRKKLRTLQSFIALTGRPRIGQRFEIEFWTAMGLTDVFSPATPNVEMVGAAGGANLWVFGVLLTMKALANETGGSYALWETVVPPGLALPPHTHSKEEEYWYLLDGELTWTVNGKSWQATKGDFIHLPRGLSHSFANPTDKPALAINSVAPGGFEQWLFEVGVPVADRSNPGKPPAETPEIVVNAISRAAEYGLTFDAPPPEKDQKDEL